MEVQGKDALMFFNLDGTFKEFGCAENITVDSIAEIIETSTVGSGTDRDFDYQSKTKNISLTGLVLNDDPTMITVWDLYNQQENFLTTNFRIVFTDTAGNIKTMAGSVIFPQITWSADQTDLASSTITMQTTGGITLSDDAVVPIITIEVVDGLISGSTGEIGSITLTDPTTMLSWTITGPFTIGTTNTWVLDGVAGRPGPGAYHIEAVTDSDQMDNHLITDAPPTATKHVSSGPQIVNTNPYGNTILYDFTANRTITFNVGT
jgi:hypothetical protein